MSTPQEPHQPGQPYAGHQPPRQQPPGRTSGEPQYAGVQSFPEGQYRGQYPAQGQYPVPAQYGTAGQSPGPSGFPGQLPPVKSRKTLWIVLGSIVGVLLLVIIGVIILVNLVGNATGQATGRADDFTKLLISGETEKAYDYLDPALHAMMPKQSFISGIASLKLNDTCKPTYNDVKVSSKNGVNSADIGGFITCDASKKVALTYRFEGGDESKLTGFKLVPQK